MPSPPDVVLGSATYIASMNLEEPAVPTGVWASRAEFESHTEVATICEQFPTLTRTDLARLASGALETRSSFDLRKLLFAIFMWGYGDTGGRQYIWSKRAIDSRGVDETMRAAVDAVVHSGPREAYQAFRGRVGGFNQGFFTKYLYFVGLAAKGAAPDTERPAPLIWDSLVNATLRNYRQFLGLDWQGRDSGSRSYAYYCAVLAQWARDLTLDRTDRLELYLWTVGAEVLAAQSAMFKGLETWLWTAPIADEGVREKRDRWRRLLAEPRTNT